MAKFTDWLKGKKTYIIAMLIGLDAAAQAMGYTVPGYIYAILGALGLGFTRAAITKVS